MGLLNKKSWLLYGLCFGLIACQDNEVGINVVNVKPFDLTTCTAALDDGSYLVSGTVDLALRDNYLINPLVRNNLLDVNEIKGLGTEDARVSTNSVVIQSAEITYAPLDSLVGNIPRVRTIPLSGTVTESNTAILFNFPLIESEVMEALRSSDTFFLIDDQGNARPKRTSVTILTSTRIKGTTLDGRTVESEPFQFPVEVCNGCMVSYPSSLLEERNGRLICPAAEASDEDATDSDESCEFLVGMDGVSTNCSDCQGYAVNTFARQLCQPIARP